MGRQRIAVDCDDVIANVNDSVREFINASYGLKHTAEDYRVAGDYRGYWARIWGVSEAQSDDWFSRYISSGRMTHLDPVDGALETLEGLASRYSLVLVTARSALEVEYTEQWLDRHAPSLFDDVTFVHRWRRAPDHQVTKGEICRELKADYLIDDNYEHCQSAATLGTKAILFGDYGWNREYELSGDVVRAADWQAVREYFD